MYDGVNKLVCYNNLMLLVLDNSDSPSIVEQLSQGPSLVYHTFINDSFLALDLSYALFLVPSFLQHGQSYVFACSLTLHSPLSGSQLTITGLLLTHSNLCYCCSCYPWGSVASPFI